jgi:hypothetical protein
MWWHGQRERKYKERGVQSIDEEDPHAGSERAITGGGGQERSKAWRGSRKRKMAPVSLSLSFSLSPAAGDNLREEFGDRHVPHLLGQLRKLNLELASVPARARQLTCRLVITLARAFRQL